MANDEKQAQTADGASGSAVTNIQAPASSGASPDATYSEGIKGGNVNFAVPADAVQTTTYEEALEAGYLGYTPGADNTEKMSVAAVTARDKAVGMPGTSGKQGAVVNKSPSHPEGHKAPKD